MIQPADLPDTLAVFPLPGALLLPRAKLPLHVFEPRYLQMFEDSLKSPQRLIGMVQPRGQGDIANRVGCAGRVTQFSETDDGRYFMTLTGVSRFTINEEVEGFTPYRRARVTWNDGDSALNGSSLPEFDRVPLMALLERFFELKGLSTDWEAMQTACDETLINSLAMHLDFQAEDKQALLEAETLTHRRETLVTLIEFALRGSATEEKMQ